MGKKAGGTNESDRDGDPANKVKMDDQRSDRGKIGTSTAHGPERHGLRWEVEMEMDLGSRPAFESSKSCK